VTVVDIRQLPAQFEEMIKRAAAGDEVIVTDDGVPRARLLSLPASHPRVAGLHAGAMQPSADFDAPLPDDFWAGQP
jgi:prevent-host-death family protein